MLFFGVDVGSVRRSGGFSWAAIDDSGDHIGSGRDDPGQLAEIVAQHLGAGHLVALAFEAPLAVPVPEDWHDLARARQGEGRRPWSAGAGTGALATGLVQAAWICRAVAERVPTTRATTQRERFREGQAMLLIAEGFVSDDGKSEPVGQLQDEADAAAAAHRLRELMRDPLYAASDVWCHPAGALNLAAAVADWSGLEIDTDEIHHDIVVAKARPVP